MKQNNIMNNNKKKNKNNNNNNMNKTANFSFVPNTHTVFFSLDTY